MKTSSASARNAAALLAVGAWTVAALWSCTSVEEPERPALVPTEPPDWQGFGEPGVVPGLGDVRVAAVVEGRILRLDWSPDGRTLLVFARTGRSGNHFVVVDPDARIVARRDGNLAEGGAWLQEGDGVVVGGAWPAVFPFDGSSFGPPVEAVGVGLEPAVCRVSGRIVSVAADRGRLLVARPDARAPRSNPLGVPTGGPWLFEGGAGEGGPVRRLADPRWAPDGSGVVFVVRSDGEGGGGAQAGIAEVDSQGARERWLVRGAGDAGYRMPTVHPGLEKVWFVEPDPRGNVGRILEVRRVELVGGEEPAEVPTSTPTEVVDGDAVCFSPDGELVAFARRDRVYLARCPD